MTLGFRGLLLAAVLSTLPALALAEDYRLPPSAAEDGIELTDFLKVKPHARIFGYYTTNLFQEPNRRKEEDTGFELSAGADVKLGDDERYLELGYTATQLLFVKNPKQNTVEHRARFNSSVALSDSITFTTNGSAAWQATNTDPQFRGRVRNFAGFGLAKLDVRPTETVGFFVDGDVTYSYNFPDAFEAFNTLTSRVGAFVVLSPRLPGDLEIIAGTNWRQIHYVDHKATNPDLELISWQAGVQADNDLMVLSVRAGYEVSYVVRRRSFSRQRETPEGLFASASLTLTPNDTTTVTLFGVHQVSFSAVADHQKVTNLGLNVEQEIPMVDGLRVFGGATWGLQDPRRRAETRTQTYLVGAGWQVHQYVEIGSQFSYLRTSSRTGGFETFEAGLSLTLKI